MRIEGIIDQIIGGSAVLVIAFLFKDAITNQRVLKSLMRFVGGLRKTMEQYEKLRSAAIHDARWPLDFYAWNFAYLLFFSVILIILCGDMSNIFFSPDYGWGWYLFLCAVSFPVSYAWGVLISAITSVASQRLEYWVRLEDESAQLTESNSNRASQERLASALPVDDEGCDETEQIER